MNKTYFYRKSRLCLLALLCALIFFRISYADVTGELDGGCKYTIDASGKLTLSKSSTSDCTLPSNNTSSTSFSGYPWQGNEDITSVYVEAGVSTGDSAAYLFYNLSGATSFGLNDLTVTGTTNMSSMFQGCSSLISLTVSNWNTGSVTNMSSMFQGCSSLTNLSIIGSWNTGSVTNMSSMFQGCSSINTLYSLSSWETGSVTDMSSMFQGCSKLDELYGIYNWKTGSVTDMSSMFQDCSNLDTLSDESRLKWNTGSVTNMSSMFQGCSLLDSDQLYTIRFWVTNKVTDASSMFQDCSSLETLNNISGWNLGSGVNMNNMFKNCTSVKSANFSGWTFNADTTGTLEGISDAVIKLNQYFSDMKGTNLYVVGKHGYSELGLSADPGNLIYEPGSVQVSFTGGNGTFSLSCSGVIDDPDTYYYTNVCTAYPNEAICASGYAKGNYQSGSDCSISDITPDNGMKIVSVTATDAAGKSTALTAPYKLENIQSNYTVDVQLGYTLTYTKDADVSGEVPAAKAYKAGATVTAAGAGNLSKTGYTFAGWEGTINGETKTYGAGDTFTMPGADVTLTAVFNAIPAGSYTVAYEKGEADSGAVPAAAPYSQGATVTVAGNTGNLAKAGYIFSCWEGTINGETRTYVAGETFTMPAANVTLTAVFNAIPAGSYTVAYEKGEADSGAVPAAAPYSQGATVTVAGNTGNLAKTGYVFSGWKGTIDGETKTFSAGAQFTMPAANVTLTAQFKQNDDPETYTLTYGMGDATGGTLPEMQQAAAGESVTLPYNTGNLTYGSYPFIGWVDQNGSEYDEGQSFIMPAVSLSFKPLFSTVQYTLSYTGGDAESGTVPASQSVYYKVYTELAGNTGNLAKSGYAFKGWTDGTTEYAAGASYRMPKMNVTLKAVFEPNSYTLTYVSDGADSGDVPEAVTVSAGTAVTIAGNDGGLSKSGFVFFCWTDGIRQYRPGTELVMPQANVTLRPVFQEEYIKNPEPLPEDEIGTYSFDENGMKIYIQFHNYDLCMVYMNDDNLCRNTSANLYN